VEGDEEGIGSKGGRTDKRKRWVGMEGKRREGRRREERERKGRESEILDPPL